jgi:hypothetical protein
MLASQDAMSTGMSTRPSDLGLELAEGGRRPRREVHEPNGSRTRGEAVRLHWTLLAPLFASGGSLRSPGLRCSSALPRSLPELPLSAAGPLSVPIDLRPFPRMLNLLGSGQSFRFRPPFERRSQTVRAGRERPSVLPGNWGCRARATLEHAALRVGGKFLRFQNFLVIRLPGSVGEAPTRRYIPQPSYKSPLMGADGPTR